MNTGLHESAAPSEGSAATRPRVGFIGFGEVTYYVAKGLASEGLGKMLIYSRPTSNAERAELNAKRAKQAGAGLASDLGELVRESDVIISSVRGQVSLDTARLAAEHIRPGKLYVDLNNAIPSKKIESARLVAAKGGSFADVGLLELPIQCGHKSLMYASGEGAARFRDLLSPYGMKIKVVDGGVGQAATIKAIANIFMKGLQGVCLEFAISARKAGIKLVDMEPLLVEPVKNMPRIMDVGFWIIRGALLAERKKAEMHDALILMESLGVDPVMLRAAVERLDRVSRFGLGERFDAAMPVEDYPRIIDAMFDAGEKDSDRLR